MKIISDSGWKSQGLTSKQRIGLHDYYRIIEFEREPSDEELLNIRKHLETDDCPGWTGVHASKQDSNKYFFTTCWDSSG